MASCDTMKFLHFIQHMCLSESLCVWVRGMAAQLSSSDNYAILRTDCVSPTVHWVSSTLPPDGYFILMKRAFLIFSLTKKFSCFPQSRHEEILPFLPLRYNRFVPPHLQLLINSYPKLRLKNIFFFFLMHVSLELVSKGTRNVNKKIHFKMVC